MVGWTEGVEEKNDEVAEVDPDGVDGVDDRTTCELDPGS